MGAKILQLWLLLASNDNKLRIWGEKRLEVLGRASSGDLSKRVLGNVMAGVLLGDRLGRPVIEGLLSRRRRKRLNGFVKNPKYADYSHQMGMQVAILER